MDIFPPFRTPQTPPAPMPMGPLMTPPGPFGPPPGPQIFVPDLDKMAALVHQLPPDPTEIQVPRPTKEVLLGRRRQVLRFWRERNYRMLEDEKLYKMLDPVEDRIGGDEITDESSTFVGNDPYVLVEKLASMVASNEPLVLHVSADPGLKEISQKIQDFLHWWRDEASDRWLAQLNNGLSRDEVYYLALRGWLAGQIMLDPGDSEWPYRYDLIDPMNVYLQIGPKGLRWVFHIYRDSKRNIINDMGFNQETLNRIDEALGGLEEDEDLEVASFYDDHWHVLFINQHEVWSAPHNYGFVPFVVAVANGPPIRRSDPASGAGLGPQGIVNSTTTPHYTRWWGVSVFEGIKTAYDQSNKLASALMTEVMKAPNPPVVMFTTQQGEAEGKTIDTSIGATNYLLYDQEKYEVVNYGFKPDQFMPLLQLLNEQRNRGALPSVMYGEGTQYLSGFAVNLLQNGARDILLPLIESHQGFLSRLFRMILKMTAEIMPFPISMIGKNPEDGERDQFQTIDPRDIKLAGYRVRVVYKNVGPQDRQQEAAMANMLYQAHLISADTARSDEFIGLKNPSLESKKVLSDMAYLDPDVVKASIPISLLETNPQLYWVYMQAQWQKFQQEMQQFQMMMQAGMQKPPGQGPSKGPPGQPSQPPSQPKLPNHVLPQAMQPGGGQPPIPPGAAPQTGPR